MEPLIGYYDNRNIKREIYHVDGEYHREDGPAITQWYVDGEIMSEEYFINGKRHRDDGPAYISWTKDGLTTSEIYYYNGEYHREDGPAYNVWFSNGVLASMDYFIHGKRHREDGPAFNFRMSRTNTDMIHQYFWYNNRIEEKWFSHFGKDINKDFTDEIVRDMILNICGVNYETG